MPINNKQLSLKEKEISSYERSNIKISLCP